VRVKQFKKNQISKIQASIRKANKIRPAQFQQEANKLFRIQCEALEHLDFFEEFEKFANSDILEPANLPKYECLTTKIPNSTFSSKVTNQLESNDENSKEEKAYEILSSFLIWQCSKKTTSL
ncbi:20478_t:CDS:2, partial [Dentiscutata erythropus]